MLCRVLLLFNLYKCIRCDFIESYTVRCFLNFDLFIFFKGAIFTSFHLNIKRRLCSGMRHLLELAPAPKSLLLAVSAPIIPELPDRADSSQLRGPLAARLAELTS